MRKKIVAILLSGGLAFSSVPVTIVAAAENTTETSANEEQRDEIAADNSQEQTEQASIEDSQQEASENFSDINVEAPSEIIDGNVYVGELSTGAVYYAYVPESENYGARATANPILIVYGDTAYTEETAKETAISSGLAQIADREGAPVIFVNPKGDQWRGRHRFLYRCTVYVQRF